MTQEVERLAVYNFMAAKLGVPEIATPEEFASKLERQEVDPRCVPSLHYYMVNADTHEIASTNWTARSEIEWFKTKGEGVVEHYRRFKLKGDLAFTNHDIETGEAFEHYYYRGNKSIRTNLDGEETQFTTFCTWETLPDEYKEAFHDYPHKDKIFGWSRRSYGRIVYVHAA